MQDVKVEDATGLLASRYAPERHQALGPMNGG